MRKKTKNMTLSIGQELYEKMEKFPWVNWTALTRENIKRKVAWLERLELENF